MKRILLVIAFLCAPSVCFAQFKAPDQRGLPTPNRVSNTNASVGAATTISPTVGAAKTWVVVTMTGSATITIGAGATGQTLDLLICQNGTGGFTPTMSTTGLTFAGTWPTFTTTASKCGDASVYFSGSSTAYLVGSQAGPL